MEMALGVDESVKAAILQKRHRDRKVMTDWSHVSATSEGVAKLCSITNLCQSEKLHLLQNIL